MGKCSICGCETEHLYNWYSADPVSSSTSTYEGVAGKTTVTTNEYTNVVQHADFVCSKCGTQNIGSGGLLLLIGGTVLLVLLGVGIIAGAAQSRNWFMGVVLCALCFVGVLFLIYNFGLPIIRRSMDKRVKEFDAVSAVWKNLYGANCLVGARFGRGWKVDGKVVFDADAYKALSRK